MIGASARAEVKPNSIIAEAAKDRRRELVRDKGTPNLQIDVKHPSALEIVQGDIKVASLSDVAMVLRTQQHGDSDGRVGASAHD